MASPVRRYSQRAETGSDEAFLTDRYLRTDTHSSSRRFSAE
jgi:hypothetical protein